jgi:hypothetical protein
MVSNIFGVFISFLALVLNFGHLKSKYLLVKLDTTIIYEDKGSIKNFIGK